MNRHITGQIFSALRQITHAGQKMVDAGRENQRKKFEEETGVKAVNAELGLKVDLN